MERISRLEEAYHADLNGGWSPGFLVEWVCRGSQGPMRTEFSPHLRLRFTFRIWIASSPLRLDLYLYLCSHTIVSTKRHWLVSKSTHSIYSAVGCISRIFLGSDAKKHLAYTIFRFFFIHRGQRQKGIQSWRLRRRLRTTAKKHTELASVELNCFGIKLHVGVQGTNLQEFKALCRIGYTNWITRSFGKAEQEWMMTIFGTTTPYILTGFCRILGELKPKVICKDEWLGS